MMFKNVRTLKEMRIKYKIKLLIALKAIVVIYSENHTKPINTLCAQISID
jgi:hypothetical protein